MDVGIIDAASSGSANTRGPMLESDSLFGRNPESIKNFFDQTYRTLLSGPKAEVDRGAPRYQEKPIWHYRAQGGYNQAVGSL